MQSFLKVSVLVMFFLALIFSASYAQIPWTRYANNPVLTPGPAGSWNDLALAPGCIIFDGTLYHFWYSGLDGTNLRIGYTTSPDGISWTEYAGNPVLDLGAAGSWDDERVYKPYVLFDSSTYHMWYTGYDGTNTRIGYATSSDGITWTKYAANPVLVFGSSGTWDDMFVESPCVIFDGNNYHMWYTGGESPHTFRIGYATSPDGIIWTKHAGNPALDLGAAGSWDNPRVQYPDVLFDGEKYHMWYMGATEMWAWRIGYATSSDGIQWTKYAGNPVLDVGTTGGWDDQWVGFSRTLFDTINSQYKMWYRGNDSDLAGPFGFGYATAPVTINVPVDVPTIQTAIDAAHDGNVVLVDEGTYYENINFKGKAITVASHYYIDGDTSHISNTIIDGSQPANPDSGSVVYFVSGEDTNSVLSGFTITGGTGTKRNFESDVEWYGGGIYCASGGRIMNNIVRNNGFDVDVVYAAGGGISAGLWGMWGTEYVIIHGNIIVSNSIMGNSECDGGGIAFFRNGRITDNIISDNSLTSDVNWGSGGGIAVGSLSENPNIVVAGNQIINNKITGIDGAYGGGIIIGYCDVPVTNNIISGNIASFGGGICLNTSNSEIINNTIANNTASSQGGGLYVLTNSNFVVLNTIFWNNEATNDSQIYGSGDVLYSDIQGGWEGKGNIDADPQFLDTLLYIIPESSPCVDAGYDSSFFNDIEDEGNLGFAKWPAMGTLINDLGAYGGPHEYDAIELRDVIDYILDVPDKNMNFPLVFNLSQNYPNPFNPITNIEYRIPNSEFVTLKIYNLLGQKVVTLVSERQKAGNHKVEWDAGQMASGVYYYQVTAGEFRDVKKMILLR